MTAARRAALSAAATALLLLAACGGDSGRAVPDVPASSAYVGKCAPDNPLARDGSGRLLARYGNGSLDDERRWVRSYMNEAYLWYAEMPSPDPTLEMQPTATPVLEPEPEAKPAELEVGRAEPEDDLTDMNRVQLIQYAAAQWPGAERWATLSNEELRINIRKRRGA